MKKRHMVSFCLVLAMLITAGCSKSTLENQSASDNPPPATAQTDASGSMSDADTASSRVSDKALGASDSAYGGVDVRGAIYFEFDSARLDAGNQANLSQKAKWLQNNLQVGSVLIEGHCDERGTDAYNMALGARRADAVKDYLIDLGVPNSKLETQSYGEEKPADPNHNESAWAKNRRADFVVK